MFGLTSMETYDPSLLWNLHWPDNPLCFAKFQDALLICYVESFVVLSLLPGVQTRPGSGYTVARLDGLTTLERGLSVLFWTHLQSSMEHKPS